MKMKICKFFLCIILGIACINILIHGYRFSRKFEDINSISKNAIASDNVQENYMVIEKKNGLLNFPYIFGNRIIIHSLSDEKDYCIMDYQSIMNQFEPSFYDGTKIYGQISDDKGTFCEIYEIDVITGKKKTVLEEEWMDEYIVSNETILYSQATENDTQILVAYDIDSKEKRILTETDSYWDEFIYFPGVYREYIFGYIEKDGDEKIIRYNSEKKEAEEFSVNKELYEKDGVYVEEMKRCMIPFGENKLLVVFDEGGICEYQIDTKMLRKITDKNEASNLLDGNYPNVGMGLKNGYLYYGVNGKGIYRKNIEKTDEKAECVIPWEDVANVEEEYDDISMVFAKDYVVAIRQKKNTEEIEYEAYFIE